MRACRYGDVFFHCDQVIRGLYEPFVRDWHAAFGSYRERDRLAGLLVLRTEDLLDDPVRTRDTLLQFLGLPGSPAAESLPRPTMSYRALHVDALKKSAAQPMLNSTRALLENFYRPHNLALAALLGWAKTMAWPTSTVVGAAELK